MTKKKILTLAMTLSMVAILAIGGTIAYFTDADYNVNVMVTGNVQIDQIEQQRADGTVETTVDNPVDDRTADILADYVDGGKLFPVTHPTTEGYDAYLITSNNLLKEDNVTYGGWKVPLFSTANNYVDKIVTVKNTGASEAYVRTVFAFQMGKKVTEVTNEAGEKVQNTEWVSLIGHEPEGVLCYTRGVDENNFTFLEEYVTIEGVKYQLAVAYYDTLTGSSLLKPNEISSPSLTQVFMNPGVTNEEAAMLGKEYKILVVSQGTQTVGFKNAEEALDEAFGEVNATNAADWFVKTSSKGISVEK